MAHTTLIWQARGGEESDARRLHARAARLSRADRTASGSSRAVTRAPACVVACGGVLGCGVWRRRRRGSVAVCAARLGGRVRGCALR
eukprot:4101914-Prymnesium_polylepis.2